MSADAGDGKTGEILVVGASRGLGLAMAGELVGRGWRVTGTVRGGGTGLHGLAERNPGRIGIETLDIAEPDGIAALRDRLSGRAFDVLFVNAGTADRDQRQTIGEVSTEEFVRVMLVNALGAMRAVEGLAGLVPPDGLIGVMSSGQGSVANNVAGGNEVYRGSKAALNQYMRGFAARQTGGRSMLLMAPGWIRTELGGPNATFGLEETVPDIVDTLLAQRNRPGLRYLDRKGQTVPW